MSEETDPATLYKRLYTATTKEIAAETVKVNTARGEVAALKLQLATAEANERTLVANRHTMVITAKGIVEILRKLDDEAHAKVKADEDEALNSHDA